MGDGVTPSGVEVNVEEDEARGTFATELNRKSSDGRSRDKVLN